ncbi:MAG: hypothetical protein VB853_13775 [Pirellulales bacterium]
MPSLRQMENVDKWKTRKWCAWWRKARPVTRGAFSVAVDYTVEFAGRDYLCVEMHFGDLCHILNHIESLRRRRGGEQWARMFPGAGSECKKL